MNLNDDVVYRCPRLGPLGQPDPRCSRGLIRHHDRPHPAPPGIQSLPSRHVRSSHNRVKTRSRVVATATGLVLVRELGGTTRDEPRPEPIGSASVFATASNLGSAIIMQVAKAA
jgi:hypothetical protein